MRGAALPAALLSVATGLVLAHTQTRTARMGAALLILPAMAVALAPLPQLSDDIVFSGAWISLIGTSVWLYREHWIRPGIAGAVALNAGLWCGLACHVGGGIEKLMSALPLVLVIFPARFAVRSGRGIALKVIASWLIAIAGMEALLPLIPTPGYRPDHMD